MHACGVWVFAKIRRRKSVRALPEWNSASRVGAYAEINFTRLNDGLSFGSIQLFIIPKLKIMEKQFANGSTTIESIAAPSPVRKMVAQTPDISLNYAFAVKRQDA